MQTNLVRDVFVAQLWWSDPSHLGARLHGEVGDVGVGGDVEVEDALGGGGVPVEHGAGDRGEGVAGDDGGLDGELVDVRSGLLRTEGPSKLMQKKQKLARDEDPDFLFSFFGRTLTEL